MQPTLTQVPPSVLSISTQTVYEAKLRGADRGDISAGPAADDDDVGRYVRSHGFQSGSGTGQLEECSRRISTVRPTHVPSGAVIRRYLP